MTGYALEYDAEYRWLISSDPEGASQIVAREVSPDDAAYLIAGYEALATGWKQIALDYYGQHEIDGPCDCGACARVGPNR